MTGSGVFLRSGGGSASHDLHVRCDPARRSTLTVKWNGTTFRLTAVDQAYCADDPDIHPRGPSSAFDTFAGSGTGTLNGGQPASATWVISDGGEGASDDGIDLVIRDADGDEVLRASGPLVAGNHQAHEA